MELNRREYSSEIKISAMRAIDGGRRIVEVARELAISPHMIGKWRALWRAQGEGAFPGQGRRNPREGANDQQRIAELERKIGQLTMENDFLKKSLENFKERQLPALVSGAAAYLKTTKKPNEKDARSR